MFYRCSEPVYCFIRSVDKDDKVMDVKGDDEDEGGRVILYKQKDGDNDNQIFYEDKHGYIHNLLTDLCFDTYGTLPWEARGRRGPVGPYRANNLATSTPVKRPRLYLYG